MLVKKTLIFVVLLSLAIVMISQKALAEGDQNVGLTGNGETNLDNRNGTQDGVIW